jgi:cytochrome c-type biogenesis protein CcmH/NrfG
MPQALEADQVRTMTREDAMRLALDADRALVAGRVLDAGAAYVRIATAFPDDARAWFRLGTIYLRTGQYGAAQYACERALRFEPSMAKAQANLALAHLHQFRAAAALASASHDVPPENRKALRALMLDVDHALVPRVAARASETGEVDR